MPPAPAPAPAASHAIPQLLRLQHSGFKNHMVLTLFPVGWFIYKTLGFLTIAVHTSSSNKHYAKQMRELEITTTRGAAIARRRAWLAWTEWAGSKRSQKVPFLVTIPEQKPPFILGHTCESEPENSWGIFK